MTTILQSTFSVLLYSYVSIRYFLNKVWISINRFISNSDLLLLSEPANNGIVPFHKIVIIGDDLAMGIGDTGVTMGESAGVAPHLLRASQLEPKIRRRWKVANRGQAGSSSSMWLPETGKCFEQTFGTGSACANADIVVILLGVSDIMALLLDEDMPPAALDRASETLYLEGELSALAKNIQAIVVRLIRDGKKVCLVDLPRSGVPGAGLGKIRCLNAQIKQICRKQGGALRDEKGSLELVSLGTNYRMLQPEFRSFDSCHLNRKGYSRLALEIFETIAPFMIHVEWNVWKLKLT